MISYTFPEELIRKTRFISGLGLDPEGVGNMYQAQYPMSRQFTFGLDLMF